MKLKYRTFEGEIVEGNSPFEIVANLKGSGRFVAEQSIEEYMERFAKRLLDYDGKVVRCDTTENFVSDLIDVGFIELIE